MLWRHVALFQKNTGSNPHPQHIRPHATELKGRAVGLNKYVLININHHSCLIKETLRSSSHIKLSRKKSSNSFICGWLGFFWLWWSLDFRKGETVFLTKLQRAIWGRVRDVLRATNHPHICVNSRFGVWGLLNPHQLKVCLRILTWYYLFELSGRYL